MYDLIIKNADILDGTGADAFRADIAIKDGKIACICNDLCGAEKIIDASGLTVSPGWIDSHSHSDRMILSFPDQKEKVEQGITFSITGQCGGSPAPTASCSIGDYMKKAALTPQGSGAALLIGHNTLRTAVMGTENRAPTRDEMARMKQLLQQSLDAGAIGMSLGLYYVPGCYADREEIIELAKIVAKNGGVLASHIRNEAEGLVESVQEYLDIIKASGCRAVFSHHKAMDRDNWGKVKTTLAMIDRANSEGADIYLDVYPYNATNTSLLARFVPKQFHPAGTKNVVRLLDDPAICQAIKNWGTAKWGEDLSWVLISSCNKHTEYEGLTLAQVAQLRGQEDQYEATFDLLRECEGKVWGSFFLVSEEDLEYVMKHPKAMICTDAAVAGTERSYHPRLRGSFPRALGRYARDRKIVPMPAMIRRMTSLPAHVYGLTGKGRIELGAYADLCIFDPQTILDGADYAHCTRNNQGLHYVIIDGKVVLENGVYNGIRAGKVIRKGQQ